MKNRLNLIKCGLVMTLLFLLVSVNVDGKKVQAFSNQVIQKGAVGEDVIELQSRLQYNGFFHGEIDGVFGWKTYWALRNFQEKFDLPKVDGLAGEDTKNMLIRATKYNEPFVKEQIEKGNDFTHYGGMDWEKQTKPAKKGAQPQTKVQTPVKKGKQTPAQPGTQSPAQTEGNSPAQPGTQVPAQPKGQAPAQPGTQTPAQPEGQAPAQPNTQTPTKPKIQEAPKNNAQAPAKEKEPPKKPTAANTPNGFSQNDIKLLANAVYGESRGEPYIGQVAVAAVILNRVNSAIFPNTVSGVIFEPGAFTAVADGQIYLTPNENAKKAVLDAINGYDPTGEAIYYFNPATATNKWIWGRPQIKKIGKHIFCK